VVLRGHKEVARLGVSFNAMAGELSAMHRRTRVLEDQMLKLQDEERADLARDLHDEIGPHLFAANIDATMIGQALGAGRTEEALAHVKSIQTAVARMQRQVREILTRLRPARLTELGFAAAIADLAQFWRARRGDIAISLSMPLDEAQIPEAIQEVAYRVVQEGLSNAVRHGRPSRIDVSLALEDDRLWVRVEDDGLARDKGEERPRFGLVGMRERIEAVGGSMTVERAHGWTLTAWAPLSGVAAGPAGPAGEDA
jgi:two-component system sensor histidine kinase UhpB